MKAVGLVVASATFLMSACMSQPIPPGSFKRSVECQDTGLCKVIVHVSNAECRIVGLDPDELIVVKKNIVIRWEFDASAVGYTFPDDGIVFKTPGGPFTDGRAIGNGKFFMWNDPNPTTPSPQRFDYAVKVLRNGAPCPTFDPAIVNQGRPS
jgi:hypothetical protein